MRLTPVILILCLCVITSKVTAGNLNYNDSLKNRNAFSSTTTTENTFNIVFPAILNGHEKQSLEYIEKYSKTKREYLIRTFNKGKKYFPQIESIFKRYNLPQEFKVLIALESGFNGNAVSPAGAVGYWQIMDPVAREYGLKIQERNAASRRKKASKKQTKKIIDERKNFNKSTYAAAKYLKDRCKNLQNDYLLIVASYNWGIGNVWNAMEKTGKASPTFWDIKKYLPAETRAYVMNFIALNVIFHNYEGFSKNKLVFKINSPEKSGSSDFGDCVNLTGPFPNLESHY